VSKSSATNLKGDAGILGIDEPDPDYGYLFGDMILPDGDEVKHADFCVRRVEPELTSILKSARKGANVGPEVGLAKAA